MDGLVNWESIQTEDSERFSQEVNDTNGNKTVKSFDVYLKRKSIYDKPKSLIRAFTQEFFLKILFKLFPEKFSSYKKQIPGKEL